MASYNRVILVGNLTRDIELRYTGGGTAVTDIGLAVNDRRKTATGEWIDETTFVDVTLWGRTAEVASEYLGKGSPILVEGRCMYLGKGDRCTVYEKRPDKCRKHTPPDCERYGPFYDLLISTPDELEEYLASNKRKNKKSSTEKPLIAV